jgi:hypothetical protein
MLKIDTKGSATMNPARMAFFSASQEASEIINTEVKILNSI